MDEEIIRSIDPGCIGDAALPASRIRPEAVLKESIMVEHGTIAVDHFHDGGKIRLSDCEVEHSTFTARNIEVGELH